MTRDWMTVILLTEAGGDGFGREVQRMVLFLYAEDGLFASTRTEWAQEAFDVLVGLFDRVGLRTNIGVRVFTRSACQCIQTEE